MNPASSEVTLPSSVDVVIVGGGIIGVSTAYALAGNGLSVAVVEKGTLGCEQSSRNWGWVRTLMRDIPEVPLALRSQQLWCDIQRQTDVGFRQNGILYLARDTKEVAEYEAWLNKARPVGAEAVMLSADEVKRRLPQGSQAFAGGMFSATDGVAEPTMATKGIATLAEARGVRILEHCAARSVLMEGSSVAGLHTEHGTIRTKVVLVAGGAWSRLFCGNLGVSLPQLKVRASVLRTGPISSPVDLAINGRTYTCRPRHDGGYTVSQFNASYVDIVPDSFRLMKHFLPTWLKNKGLVKLRFGSAFFKELGVKRKFGFDEVSPFEQCRTLDPPPSRAGVESSLKKLAVAIPAFKEATIQEMWGGHIDVTPDALPIISRVPEYGGLFVATGFSGHGFGIGPAVGEAVSDLMLGRRSTIDLSPFDLGRFA